MSERACGAPGSDLRSVLAQSARATTVEKGVLSLRAKLGRTCGALALAVGLFAAYASPALAADSFTPNPVVVTLQAGASTTINKTLHLDALPGSADILIAIDTTGSMSDRHRAGEGAGHATLHRRAGADSGCPLRRLGLQGHP